MLLPATWLKLEPKPNGPATASAIPSPTRMRMPSSTHGRSRIRSTRAGRSARQVAGWASAQAPTVAIGQASPANE
ncbi:MAG: hypothetical protein BGO11_09380 [Solirubrobacterales bacterium 70-9]|nr:MAG: hypothetical protein BGO11_09380 [Solirubrobacterales bacterium 70-9]